MYKCVSHLMIKKASHLLTYLHTACVLGQWVVFRIYKMNTIQWMIQIKHGHCYIDRESLERRTRLEEEEENYVKRTSSTVVDMDIVLSTRRHMWEWLRQMSVRIWYQRNNCNCNQQPSPVCYELETIMMPMRMLVITRMLLIQGWIQGATGGHAPQTVDEIFYTLWIIWCIKVTKTT